jgi:hypothetical protein
MCHNYEFTRPFDKTLKSRSAKDFSNFLIFIPINPKDCMQRITSTDLEAWAPKRDCQEHLPLLVRRLIRATALNVLKMLFPAGDNVILPGYDGILEVENGTDHIPSGKSVWEIGTGKEPRGKAASDYKTRTEEVTDINLSETTFVFVTPRVWTGKEEWAKQKREEEKWKDVRVVDGRILEEWLELLPSVGAWLAKFLSTPFANILPIEEFWKEWSANVEHKIPSTLVISGRQDEVQKLTNFFTSPPSLLSVKASTSEEAIAFIAACIESMDAEHKEQVYARTIIVENEQDFRPLVPIRSPLILLPQFEAAGILDQAVRNGHHVITPLSSDMTVTGEDYLKLSRIKRNNFENGLKDMGFDFDKVQQLVRNSGQSLSVLRRLLKFEKYQQPAWAKNGHHTDIIPALLAGMWREGKAEDKVLIRSLAGEPYQKYVSKLSRWKVEKDAPIFQVASLWRITSALDAWSVLARFLTMADLENFRTAFLTAMGEIDPALELESDHRYMASVYGKEAKFSYSIKEGLCQSLILIAVYGEQFGVQATNSPQAFADRLVCELLNEADGKKWCSLSNVLPLLAEASPSSFLSAVEFSLRNVQPPVMEMFGLESADNLFTANSYYTGLLWALENLAYSTEHLLRVTLLLGQLSRLDPGVKLVNRPINSLREIYNPWYNQVDADFQYRQTILDKLSQKEPDVAWMLLLRIAPQDRIIVHPIHKCRWRYDPGNLKRSNTYQQGWDFDSFVFDRLILLAKGNNERVSALIDFYPNVNFEDREKLLQFLKEYRHTYDGNSTVIWDQLRELISKHKEHAEQRWALPGEELQKLQEVFNLFKPVDEKKEKLFLFEDGYFSFPAGLKRKELSYEDRQKFVNEQRLTALQRIYGKERLEGIIGMAKLLERPQHLARTAANLNLIEEEEVILLALLEKNQPKELCLFAHEYILVKSVVSGEGWTLWAWQQVESLNADNGILARFFLALPQRKHSWELLNSASTGIIEIYWRNMIPYMYNNSVEENQYVLKGLQSVNRHVTVLDEVTHIADQLPSEFLAEVLTNAATIPSDENKRLHSYGVGQVFETIHTRNDLDSQQIAQLEMLYLGFLTDLDTEKRPKQLFKILANNPDFFVEIVSLIYFRDDHEKGKEHTEEELHLRHKKLESAMKLLESWREIPGVGQDGQVDKIKLRNWVSAARTKAQECKMTYGVDSEIGNLLACYPRNNTSWPPDEVCEIIDTLNSDAITSHFETETFNSRGVSVRSAYEGGAQERNLADYFEKMAKSIAAKWPVTSGVLLKLATGYANDAKREDESAHLDELR